MKPDAVNAGVPSFSIGELAAWTHDMHLEKYNFVFSEVIIKDIQFEEGSWYYRLIVLVNGAEFTCFERNLRPLDEALLKEHTWRKKF
jgi:hypothetical protein